MKFFRPKKATGFTLVEIMIVVLIIGILLAIAIPNFVSARESSRAKACVGNLKQIDSATQQWCMDQKKNASNYGTGPSITTDLFVSGGTGYLRAAPACPSNGAYTAAAFDHHNASVQHQRQRQRRSQRGHQLSDRRQVLPRHVILSDPSHTGRMPISGILFFFPREDHGHVLSTESRTPRLYSGRDHDSRSDYRHPAGNRRS